MTKTKVRAVMKFTPSNTLVGHPTNLVFCSRGKRSSLITPLARSLMIMMKLERWLTKIERIFLVKSYLLGRVEVLHCQFVVSENWWFVGPEVSEMSNQLRVCPIPLTTTRTITTPGPPSDDNHSSWYHSNFFGVNFLLFHYLGSNVIFFFNCVFSSSEYFDQSSKK